MSAQAQRGIFRPYRHRSPQKTQSSSHKPYPNFILVSPDNNPQKTFASPLYKEQLLALGLIDAAFYRNNTKKDVFTEEVRPALVSLLPTDEATYRNTFPQKPFNVQAFNDVQNVVDFGKNYSSRVYTFDKTAGADHVFAKLKECTGANTVVILAHALEGGYMLRCPNGDKISTRLVIKFAKSHGMVPLIVSCDSATFRTGKIDIATALDACKAAFMNVSYSQSTINEYAQSIKVMLDSKTSSKWRVKIIKSANGFVLLILIMELLDDNDEQEDSQFASLETSLATFSNASPFSSSPSPSESTKLEESSGGEGWLWWVGGVGLLIIICGVASGGATPSHSNPSWEIPRSHVPDPGIRYTSTSKREQRQVWYVDPDGNIKSYL